jgi:hypothetical protein
MSKPESPPTLRRAVATTALCLLAAIAMGIAACGDGGRDDAPPLTPSPPAGPNAQPQD